MSFNPQDPAAIYSRFHRTLLTDNLPVSAAYYEKIVELVPIVKAEFEGDLTEYEIFLLAGLLVNIRELAKLADHLSVLKSMSES